MPVKTYHLDPEKFPRVRRNIILTYVVLALAALGLFYLYMREVLFTQARMLIPVILLLFAVAGWYALRQRRKYWDQFEMRLTDQYLIRFIPGMPEMRLTYPDITGVREVRHGLILSTRISKNTLLIPKALRDQDYQSIKTEISRRIKQPD